MIVGVEARTNTKNRFRVLRVHYTADPEKRKPEWKDRIKSEYSKPAWDQEQEINFGSYAGKGVYKRDFIDDLVENGGHILDEYTLTQTRPIYRVWDFGYHHPAVAFIQEDGSGHHIIFDELMGDDIFLHNFAPLVMEKTDEYAGQYSGHIKEYCDRAATQKKSTGKSDLEILHEFGIHPSYQQFDIISSIDYVRRALKIRRGDSKPVLQVVGSRCPIIRAGLNGGYRYPPKQKSTDVEKEQPLKDGYYEHLADCVRYYCGHRLRNLRATMEVIDGKIRFEKSEGTGGSNSRTSEIQQFFIRAARIGREGDPDGGGIRFTQDGRGGKPEIPIAEDGEDATDEARYSSDGSLLPSALQAVQGIQNKREVKQETAGGVTRRQIMVRYNPIAGPVYNRHGG